MKTNSARYRSLRAGTLLLLTSGLLLAAYNTQAALPNPLVNMRFSEATGTTTANTGSLAGNANLEQGDAAGYPVLTNITPSGTFTPPSNTSALDMGPIYSTNSSRAVDLTPTSGDGTLGGLNQFTVCGWLNARDLVVGAGGNRIAFALDAPNGMGFDLVQLASGALRIGVNQWPDGANGGGPTSAAVLKADPNTRATNWVFFAVTYDPSLETGSLKYFFGSPSALASQSSAHNYKGPELGLAGIVPSTGPLTIGNFGPIVGARTGAGGNSRVFRGLIDEVRIFDVVLSLPQIQEAQMNGAPPPVAATITQQPANRTTFVGQPVTFSVVVNGTAPFTFQWQRNGTDIPGETSETYTLANPTSTDNGATFRVKVSNAGAQNVLSDAATLTVLSDDSPRVSLSFSDGDILVTNRGSLEGAGRYEIRDGYPQGSSKVPAGTLAPPDNIASVDFGPILAGQGARAIDLTNKYDGTVGPMTAFTVTGWLNCRDLDAGWGGNRIVFALAEPGGPGFDLVQQEDGSLRIGVNQWPDAGAGGPASSIEKISVDPELGAGNWVFFAVTYDSALPDNNVSYYFGSPTTAAQLDISAAYFQGPITRPGVVSIGNFGPVEGARNALGPNGNSRVFRGLIDEINVFGKAMTLAEIQNQQKAAAYKPVVIEPAGIAQQPQSQTVFAGQNVSFGVTASGSPPLTYQWWNKVGGTETAISGATNQNYAIQGAAVAASGNEYWVVVSNQGGSAPSQRAVLTVLPETNHKVSMSFSEASGLSTANAGNLGGSAGFTQNSDLPAFSTLVPSGPNAPVNNTSSIDFGVIGDGQGSRAIDLVNGVGSTLGSMTGFTVTGWLNAKDLDAGWGGNRIVFALASPNGPGFDLVQQEDGSLRMGVNHWPDDGAFGGPTSSPGKINADPDAGAANWVFFAATYDSTLASGHATYYFGSPSQAAELDVTLDYDAGPVQQSGSVTIGNFGTVVGARNDPGPNGGSRVFRGLLDEINVFNKVLTLAEIQAQQKAPANAAPVNAPAVSATLQQNQLKISWDSSATFQLQFRDSLSSGNWANEPTQPVVSGNQKTVTVQPTSPSRFYRLIK